LAIDRIFHPSPGAPPGAETVIAGLGKHTLSADQGRRPRLFHLGRGKKLLYSLLMMIIPVLVLELGLRALFAFQVGPSVLLYGTSAYHQVMNGDASLRTMLHHVNYWKYYPHQIRYTRDKEHGGVIRAGINSFGFRGPEFQVRKPDREIRVVTIGASSTFGFSDRDNETYPRFLERMLNDRCPAGQRFEVINLGIPHLKSEQLLALFRAEALPLHPDIVTFYEGVNDSWNSPIRQGKLEANQLAVRKHLGSVFGLGNVIPWLSDHFVTALLLDKVSRPHNVTFTREDFERHVAGKSEKFLKNVAQMEADCRQEGIAFIVVSQQSRSLGFPRKSMRGLTYEEEGERVERKLREQHHLTDHELYFLTHRILMHDLKAWALSHQIPFVDGIRALDQHRDVLVSWVHLNAEGNRLLADAIATEILALADRPTSSR
jgi:lysophospholipase L1-like esterase